MNLYNKASLIITPNAYKAGKIYALKPTSGAGDLDVVRNTTATYVGADGLNKTALANVPRLDYTNGSCPSILVEPQRTNLFLQSEDFTNGWSQEGISITGNTQISPEGLSTADSIFESGTNDVHRTYRNTPISVTANAIYTASFFVKKNNIRYIRLILTQQGSATIWAGAQFDLDTQTFTSQVGNGGGVFSGASITPFINGWYRISVSGSITGTSMFSVLALSNGSALLNTDARGCPVYLGNVNNSLYIWGAQLEAGSNATSYIPTTSSAVTRNADVITKSNVYTENLITSNGGTLFLRLNKNDLLVRQSAQGIFLNQLINNTGYGLHIVNLASFPSSGRLGVRKIDVNGNIAIYTTTESELKLLLKWNGSSLDIFQNGIKVVSNSSFLVTNMQFLSFQSLDVVKNINNCILFPTALTDQQCIDLTTL